MENVDNEGGADIAQMIVLGGFLVAIGIVAVTLSLNLIIFSQDLSTRDTGEYERSVHETNTVMDRGALEALESANRQYLSDTPEPGDIDESEINAFLGDFEEAMGNLTEHRGRLSSMDTDETEVTETNWRIVQNESGTIESTEEGADWNLTQVDEDDGDWVSPLELDEINRLRFNITGISDGDVLYVFSLVEREEGFLTSPNTGWTMRIEENEISTCTGEQTSNDAYIVFDDFFCEAIGSVDEENSNDWDGEGVIDVTAGTVNGQQVDEDNDQDWSETLQSSEIDGDGRFIRIENEDDVQGTYDIMFNEGGTPTDVTAGDTPGSHENRLFVTGAVYEAEFEMEYRDGSVSHTRGMEVRAP